jgi:RNA polymerase sigma factor (TIGR02999 family)
MTDVTHILSQIEQGDPNAAERLLPLVYDELRKLAARRMVQESPDHTLEATALVHEAYIRLVDVKKVRHWDSRGHFFAAAAEAMRRILIEQARRKRGPKAGGRHNRVAWSHVEPEVGGPSLDLLALNDALERLDSVDARSATLVKLRFFAGLTNDEAARALGISATTAKAEWTYAKTWLRAEMSEGSTV